MARPKKEKPIETESNSSVSIIDKELRSYERKIHDVQKAMEDVDLSLIKDSKIKLDMAEAIVKLLEKLPKLLLSLKELRESATKDVGNVRGQQELSEIETGEI